MRSASGAARSVTRARRAQRANAQTAPRGAGRPRGFRKVERTARGGVSKAILQLLHRPACDQNFSAIGISVRSEEHTSELQSPDHLVCRLLLEKKKNKAI